MSLDSAVLGVYKRQLFCEPANEKIEAEVEISRIPFNIDLGWSELIVEEVDCIAEHCFYAPWEFEHKVWFTSKENNHRW